MTTAIVLAGGASRRFGSDKLAATLDGRPLLQHALEAVAAVAADVVLVVAPDAAAPTLPERIAARTTVIHDTEAFGGPLAGLAAGLAHVRSDVALVIGGDMPRLDPGVLRLLIDAVGADRPHDCATLEADPPSALPMVVRVAPALDAARALLAQERRALKGLTSVLPATQVPEAAWRALDPDGRTLADVDTPDDLRGP